MADKTFFDDNEEFSDDFDTGFNEDDDYTYSSEFSQTGLSEFDEPEIPGSPKTNSTKQKKQLSMPVLFSIVSLIAIVLAVGLIFFKNYTTNKQDNTSTPQPSVTAEANKQNPVTQGTASGIRKVKEPVIKETYEANGAVTNKYTIQLNNQILYVLDITISRDGKNRVFQYYTGKDVYDAMTIGTDVATTYTGDSDSNFILISLKKL